MVDQTPETPTRSPKKRRKKNKSAIWERREEIWMQPLREAGIFADIVSFQSRHCRIETPKFRFDFWPSSQIWIAFKPVPENRWKIAFRGVGPESLIKAASKSKTPAKIT